MSELAIVEERPVSDRNEEQLVTMTVEGQLFGLPILSVQDIVETHNITQVPRTPSAISGIMNLRGRIVTVINLRRILGRNDESSSRMGVTVEYHGDLYTILVDEIGEVRLLDRSDFEAAPATLDPKLKQLCTGIYRLDGELLAVLDVNQILSAETIAQTPPIRFIARRPKEIKEAKDAKALPAPANEDAEEAEEAEAQDTDEAAAEEVKAKPKPSKNPFRKKTPASKAKAEEKAEDKSDDKAEKPAAKPSKPAEPAEPAKPAAAASKPAEEAKSGAICGAEDAPMTENATDVAPGAPTMQKQSDDLLELLGGESKLAACISAFLESVAADDALASHYDGVDLNAQGQAMQKFMVSALKAATDGNQVSSPGHSWLSPNKGIDDEGFNLCLNHFEKALSGQSVPEGTIFRVLATFELYREAICD